METERPGQSPEEQQKRGASPDAPDILFDLLLKQFWATRLLLKQDEERRLLSPQEPSDADQNAPPDIGVWQRVFDAVSALSPEEQSVEQEEESLELGVASYQELDAQDLHESDASMRFSGLDDEEEQDEEDEIIFLRLLQYLRIAPERRKLDMPEFAAFLNTSPERREEAAMYESLLSLEDKWKERSRKLRAQKREPYPVITHCQDGWHISSVLEEGKQAPGDVLLNPNGSNKPRRPMFLQIGEKITPERMQNLRVGDFRVSKPLAALHLRGMPPAEALTLTYDLPQNFGVLTIEIEQNLPMGMRCTLSTHSPLKYMGIRVRKGEADKILLQSIAPGQSCVLNLDLPEDSLYTFRLSFNERGKSHQVGNVPEMTIDLPVLRYFGEKKR